MRAVKIDLFKDKVDTAKSNENHTATRGGHRRDETPRPGVEATEEVWGGVEEWVRGRGERVSVGSGPFLWPPTQKILFKHNSRDTEKKILTLVKIKQNDKCTR